MSPYKLYSALQAEAAADTSLGAKLVPHQLQRCQQLWGSKPEPCCTIFHLLTEKNKATKGKWMGISSSWNSHCTVGFEQQILSKSRQGTSKPWAWCCSTLSCPPALLGAPALMNQCHKIPLLCVWPPCSAGLFAGLSRCTAPSTTLSLLSFIALTVLAGNKRIWPSWGQAEKLLNNRVLPSPKGCKLCWNSGFTICQMRSCCRPPNDF